MSGRKTSGGGRRVEVEGLNPDVLKWARERAGHSVSEVARKLKKAADLVEEWEAGTSAPTYSELEHLAYDVLQRPLAIFFFPAPPAEETPEESFRTLPGFEIEKLEPSTRLSIRRAHADQLAMMDLFGGRSPVPNPLLRAVVLPARPDVGTVATSVRQALGVRLEEQTGVWKDEREALDRWRAAVEAVGVYVFKTSLKQRSISGFCLFDPDFPVIVLNNSTSLTRQLFTLMHELGHLLEQTGGVTTADDEFVRALRGEAREIEVFCNRFAAEILVPPDDFRRRTKSMEPSDDSVSALARTYKVSREAVLRRFLDLGRITQAHYQRKAKEWAEGFDRRSRGDSGGDYYRTKASYLSPAYLQEVFARYLRGSLTSDDAAGFLGVKPSHLPGLEEIVLRRVPA